MADLAAKCVGALGTHPNSLRVTERYDQRMTVTLNWASRQWQMSLYDDKVLQPLGECCAAGAKWLIHTDHFRRPHLGVDDDFGAPEAALSPPPSHTPPRAATP